MTRTSHDFDGTNGLVTGATGLLGRAVAQTLIASGAKVTLADLPGEDLSELAENLGPRARSVALDVTDEYQVERAVQAALQWGEGTLDFVFNNAGVEGPIVPITDLDPVELTRVLAVNVVGAAMVLKHSLRVVGREARIVQTGSTASIAGSPGMASYVASKHALLGLTKSASRESADRGVRVTALLPGPIDGPMMRRIAYGRYSAGATPTTDSTVLDGGRLADVDEIVSGAMFLLSKESSFMSGTSLIVDGGRTA